MWRKDKGYPARAFSKPPASWKSSSNRQIPAMPLTERKRYSPSGDVSFHVIHKVPPGDSPYSRAKHAQLVDKDPSRAVSLFWAAINSGDRVGSALKDMAVTMKQLNRPDDAIEAIKSFRYLCPFESQESLDNLLVELYKRSGRIEEEVQLLEVKLKHIEEGLAFGGRRTKPVRSQGKKVHITIDKEYTRVLGNLAWAYLQQNRYKSAEELYRKALSFDQDKNKQCNLAICLMYLNKLSEAKFLLEVIRSSKNGYIDETYAKSYYRATQILAQLESQSCDEVRIPFSSLIGMDSEEFPVPNNESQDHNSGFAVYRKLTDDHEKENSKCSSSGPVNELQSFPKISLTDKLKRGSYGESFYDTRAGFSSRRSNNGASVAFPFTQPRRGSYTFDYGDQRNIWEHEEAVNGCNRKLSFIDIGEVERESHEIVSEETLDSNTFVEQNDNNLKETKEFQSQCKPVRRNLEVCGDYSFSISKRNQACMIQEENMLLSERSYFPEPLRASRIPARQYSDENINCNVTFGSVVQVNQTEYLNQKMELLDLKDRKHFILDNVDREVRRSLCFDHQHKADGEEQLCSSSPLSKKDINVDNFSSLVSNEIKYTSADGTPANSTRRIRRLQVFQDITLCDRE